MTSKADFTHDEWITCQTLAAFVIKMAIQFGGDVETELKLANAALRERGLAAKSAFAREYILWEPTAEEEKARGALLSGRDYAAIVNRSLELFQSKLSEDELDETRGILFYVAENISRIGLRTDPDYKSKMLTAQALFDEILAYGVDDLNKKKRAVIFIQTGKHPPA
jgi:hypothetical protein